MTRVIGPRRESGRKQRLGKIAGRETSKSRNFICKSKFMLSGARTERCEEFDEDFSTFQFIMRLPKEEFDKLYRFIR